MESIGGRTVAFQIDEDGELMIAIDGDDAILSVESFQKLREWLGPAPETTERPPPDGYASWYDAAVAERVRRVEVERQVAGYKLNAEMWAADVIQLREQLAAKSPEKASGQSSAPSVAGCADTEPSTSRSACEGSGPAAVGADPFSDLLREDA